MKLPDEYRHRESVGTEVRYNCPACGDTKERLYVTRTAKGHLYHCHNCAPKMSGFVYDKSTPTPTETLHRLSNPQVNQIVEQSEIVLPKDFTPDIPMPGLAWLYKYGITDEEIQRYSFGYSSYHNRLVLPVYDADARLCYYQARTLGVPSKSNPKYINVRSKGKDGYFWQSARNSFWGCFNIVLVEDILSAVKVGRSCNCIGLLGSYIPSSLTSELVKYHKIYIWLDADKWKESIKYAIKLSAQMGKQVVPIYTEMDPKGYTTRDIAGILGGSG